MNKFEDVIDMGIAGKIFSEAGESLVNALKADVLRQLRATEDENKRLRNENERLRLQAVDIYALELSVKKEEERIKREAKQMTVEEFLGMHAIVMYRARQVKDSPLPKCNKCDEERLLHYKTPLGKSAVEQCDCAEPQFKYVPEELIVSEFRKVHGNLLLWFKPYSSHGTGYAASEIIKEERIYRNGQPFSRWNRHLLRFRDEQDCQAYCDWLNARADKNK